MTPTETIHQFAEQNMLAAKYLLGELSGADLEDFEQHMFECSICFESVKAGQVFTQGIKDVSVPPLNWRAICIDLLKTSVCFFLAGIALVFVWPNTALADIGKALLFISLGVLLSAVTAQAVHMSRGGRS